MPCTPILCKTCKYQNTQEKQNCDLSDQWAIFGSDPNESCEVYVKLTPKLESAACDRQEAIIRNLKSQRGV